MPDATCTSDRPTVEEHRDWLQAVVARRVPAADLVEDVLQEVALAIAKTSTWPLEPTEQRAWICTIAIRQAAMLARSESRRSQHQRAATKSSDHEVDNDPLVGLLREEHAELLKRTLAELPPADRRLLVWKYLEQFTYAAIADRLGVSTGVVEYRLAKLRRDLRTRLASLEDDQE